MDIFQFHDWLLAFNGGRCSPRCYRCMLLSIGAAGSMAST